MSNRWYYTSEGFTPTKGPLEAPKTVSRDIVYSFKSLAENLPKRTDSKTNESEK